ncbi:alpha/beta fold hydrolase [Nocardiopsis suaedae]|uniref:Alpha/beta hydrolase n=1 Tax=Nocardiopsis suaedae TaxID=3018444 RepID=A0ABT4TVX6_9ACTN|nr:alpha/beta hydrolase [Nocardiopsis suaedae]MDA2808837.1 alpha/beta hydrolase [Nocardiopsis suaedae]
MEQVFSAGVPIRCAVEGDPAAADGAPPVLLLHGFGSNQEMNWVRTGWPAALEGRATIAPDLRGHGGSGKPYEDDAYTPERIADDVVHVLDAVGAKRVDVVGYSMGSRNAWELALRHPARVRRLVLAGFGPKDPFAGADLHALERDGSPFGKLYRVAGTLPGNDLDAMAACARGQASRPFTPEPVPDAPILFAAGERDTVAEDVEELAERCGAEVVRVPDRDHVTAVSARALKEAVLDFLAVEEPAGSSGS